MVAKRAKIPEELRQRILKRDGYRCVVCDSTEDLVVHMIKPAWRVGGAHDKARVAWRRPVAPRHEGGKKAGEKKVQIGASVDPVLRDWLDRMVEEGRFGSRSHGVEESLKAYKEFLERGKITRILP